MLSLFVIALSATMSGPWDDEDAEGERVETGKRLVSLEV